jgi:hypothetical protein
MEVLGDVGHVKSCFSPFGDGVSVSARWCMVCAKCRNHFGCPRWFSLVTRLKCKLVSVRFEIILILTQNRCMVCAECTIGLKSFWTHPMELIDDMAHVEPR